MSKQKVSGTLNSSVTMLMYYYQALVEEGCQDPKQEMATNLSALINLSEAQSAYVSQDLENNPIRKTLESMRIIIEGLIVDATSNKKADIKTLRILQKSTQHILALLGGEEFGIN